MHASLHSPQTHFSGLQFSSITNPVIVSLVLVGLFRVEFYSDLWTLAVRIGLFPVLVLAGLILSRVPEQREIKKIVELFQKNNVFKRSSINEQGNYHMN